MKTPIVRPFARSFSLFLCEDNGRASLMRLVTLLVTVAATVFGGWAIATNSEIGEELAVSFLSVAVLGKFAQKTAEQKRAPSGLLPQELDDGK